MDEMVNELHFYQFIENNISQWCQLNLDLIIYKLQ
jgi:hypothetical protein